MRVYPCLSALVAAVALAAQPVSIQFKPVDRPILNERLRRVSTKNAERAQRLREMFQEAGCTGDNLRDQEVKGSKIPNIICTKPGQSDAAIVVGARLDWWGRNGQGVLDNWSGAALLPSLFQSLPEGSPRHTFVFIGFADQESSPAGSRYYVRQLSKDQKSRVQAMVQLTSLGSATTRVWMDRSDQKLINDLARVAAAMKIPVTGVNMGEDIGRDDAAAFREARIPTISLHSLTQDTFSLLDTAQDNVELIKPDLYYDSYRVVAAYLMLLDAVLTPPAR